MFEALRRTRCILISGKHLLGNFLPYPRIDPFLAEHLEVIEALLSRDAARARLAMRHHLEAAQDKVETRLTEFRARYTITPISYVSSP
jgi:DNA-binding GntR family transcriptional regulator